MLLHLLLPFPAHFADLLVLLPLCFFEPFGIQLGALDGANEMVGVALGVLLGSEEGVELGMLLGSAVGSGEQSNLGKVNPRIWPLTLTLTEKSDVFNRERIS